ncbi:DNA-methyltransferase [Leptospira alstonii]|uniref:Methyltransferase n=1 Tax=Leptospira alstonii serovar Sichuan str. 79601 TaxID=1218565 RepID=M6CUU6_9LEPT|nr:site-specific DNA-methyltransferase [Leptospira alstonii]AGS80546.1 DNA methylase family protein [Leptospira phage vB_LalZ_80412-LE1]EMJ95469.1 DNA methylase family protein [Leptospira alstonii serovar Sichuan str. 79601]
MSFEILHGDSFQILKNLTLKNPTQQFDCIVTSPPYFQKRNYLDVSNPLLPLEIGREGNQVDYLGSLREVFLQSKKLLKESSTIFVNLGDTFRRGRTLKVPFHFVEMMEGIGYHYIQEIIWAKSITTKTGNIGSCKPESVRRRFTLSHEYVLFFVKDLKEYYFNSKIVSVPSSNTHNENKNPQALLKTMLATEDGKEKSNGLKNYEETNAENPSELKKRIIENKIKNFDLTATRRSVWQIQTPNSRTRHTAVGPEELFEICILAGSPLNGSVLDPFVGEGTVGKAALRQGRSFLGIDLDIRSCLEAKNNLEEWELRTVS